MIFEQNFLKQGTMEKGNVREWWTAKISYISAHVYMDTDSSWKWRVENMTSLNTWVNRQEAQKACTSKVRKMIDVLLREVEQ